MCIRGFPGGSVVKNPPGDARDTGSIPGSGSSPGGGNGNPLQYSCLKNPTDSGAWRAAVHTISKSWAQLSHSTRAWVYMHCTMSALVSLYIDVNVYSELSGDSL